MITLDIVPKSVVILHARSCKIMDLIVSRSSKNFFLGGEAELGQVMLAELDQVMLAYTVYTQCMLTSPDQAPPHCPHTHSQGASPFTERHNEPTQSVGPQDTPSTDSSQGQHR